MFRSPDHLAEALPDCAPQVARYGAAHRYALDCLVRHLQETGWQGALDLGQDPTQQLTIVAGIGTLTLTATSSVFTPTARGASAPAPTPIPAAPELAAQRLRACAACTAWDGSRCTIAGCSCAGLGKAENLFSKCPKGMWPELSQAT